MTTHPDHPAQLAKTILCEYLKTWTPDAEGPVAGNDGRQMALETAQDDVEPETEEEPAGPHLLVYGAEEPVEIAEGSGVWRVPVALGLKLPVDAEPTAAEAQRRDLWAALTMRISEEEPLGEQSPLAPRLTAVGLAWAAVDGGGEGGPVWWCADVLEARQGLPEVLESEGGIAGTLTIYSLTLVCGLDAPEG